MICMINYDLKSPVASYTPLYEAIKSYGVWWHYLESAWIIKTNDSPKEIYSKLLPTLKQGDSLIITDITNSSYYGILPPKAWEWIEQNRV